MDFICELDDLTEKHDFDDFLFFYSNPKGRIRIGGTRKSTPSAWKRLQNINWNLAVSLILPPPRVFGFAMIKEIHVLVLVYITSIVALEWRRKIQNKRKFPLSHHLLRNNRRIETMQKKKKLKTCDKMKNHSTCFHKIIHEARRCSYSFGSANGTRVWDQLTEA